MKTYDSECHVLIRREGDSGIEPGNRAGMKGGTHLELLKWVFSSLFKHRDMEFKQGGEI